MKELLEDKGIKSMLIDSKSKSKEREKILSEWGNEFFPLLSVLTLEIGLLTVIKSSIICFITAV